MRDAAEDRGPHCVSSIQSCPQGFTPSATNGPGIRNDLCFEPPALREVSVRIAAVNGINLGQGLCLYPPPPLLIEAAKDALSAGMNTYAPPQGSYYILADTGQRFPGISSEEVSLKMIEETGVGAVPASDFFGPEVKGNPQRSHFLRFCFSNTDSVLEEAGKRLAAF